MPTTLEVVLSKLAVESRRISREIALVKAGEIAQLLSVLQESSDLEPNAAYRLAMQYAWLPERIRNVGGRGLLADFAARVLKDLEDRQTGSLSKPDGFQEFLRKVIAPDTHS